MAKIKRFAVFGIIDYYPSGGWDDFYDSAETLEEARVLAAIMIKDKCAQYEQIIDLESGEAAK